MKNIFNRLVIASIFTVILILVPFIIHSETVPKWTVIEVIDGDTIVIQHSDYFYTNPKIRLLGIDTPESWRPKCDNEKLLGLKAKEFVKKTIADVGNIVTLGKIDKDKYGRILTTVYVGNKDLSELLIKNGLGIPYFGDAKTNMWCD